MQREKTEKQKRKEVCEEKNRTWQTKERIQEKAKLDLKKLLT
jgi:hypothetical protein